VSIQSISLEKTISINRDQFNQLILPIIKKTNRCVKSALKDADLSTEDIEEIIMVGGSTRIPYVREEVEQLFNKIPHTSLNPDEVVAIGASIQAGILAGEIKETVLLDICPLSLGLETMGGVVSKFIARNSKIPCFATETFTTHVDNQTAVSLHILQGEREFVKDCSSLGKFSLKGIEPAIAGVPRIEVKFQIDANGILNVSAVDEATGNSKEINVKPHIGLTDEIVEDMLLDSLKNIKSDMESRMTKDAMIEAEAVILATERQLLDFISLLEKENIDLITESIRELKKVVKEGTNKDLIIGLTEDLDKEAQKFAELIMNSTIKKVLTDKTIEDLQG
jgi:molecular chaperone DnaK (HSP70)